MSVKVEKLNSACGAVHRLTLTNASGGSVVLSTLGAGIAGVNIPVASGHLSNLVAEYIPFSACELWDYEIVGDDEVELTCEHQNAGKHSRKVSYRWTADNVLEIYFQEGMNLPDSPDVLGQTYFNLGDHKSDFLKEYLWINSSASPFYSPTMQLSSRVIGEGVFDHRWRLLNYLPDVMNDAALLASHCTGIQLSIITSYPTLRVVIPTSRAGVAFSTHVAASDGTLCSPQTTFLHFSRIR